MALTSIPDLDLPRTEDDEPEPINFTGRVNHHSMIHRDNDTLDPSWAVCECGARWDGRTELAGLNAMEWAFLHHGPDPRIHRAIVHNLKAAS